MSSENPPHSEVQEVPAEGNASDNYEFSRTATYEDLVQNPELFWDKLKQFLCHIHKTFKIPYLYGKSLDLHRLFTEVTCRGGLQKVIKDRRCKEVMDIFKFGANITNAAFVLRKFYQKFLFEFEHFYYFREPLSSFPEREEALKQLGQKYENCDNGTTHELQRGVVVDGIIDGKFDSGYFVTVNVGSEELKGVLYHSSYKKRSSKSSEMESKRPKFQRSGYNFFVSDHYSRVKAEYVGQDPRLIMKEIGNMWSNLSASDKQVYQERGLEDAQRYNKEMEQYKTIIMDTCGAGTVAATDASTSANAEDTETEAEAMAEAEAEAMAEAEAEAETETETAGEAETETEIAAETETETETAAETKTETAGEVEAETETAAEAKTETAAETAAETEAETAAKAEAETAAKAEAEAEADP